MARPPVIPSLYSALIDKAQGTSKDGKLITLKREDVIKYEDQTRRYYNRITKAKVKDFTHLNSFLLIFYHAAIPDELPLQTFKILLACYLHSNRDYLLAVGVTRTDAHNTLKTHYFSGATIRPYFPTYRKESFNNMFYLLTKRKKLLRPVPYKAHHPTERKFMKRHTYYELTHEGESIIKQFQSAVVKNYDDVVSCLRAQAHLLTTFKDIPTPRNLKKSQRLKHQKRLKKTLEDLYL